MLLLRRPCLAPLILGLLVAPAATLSAGASRTQEGHSQPATRPAATAELLSERLISLNDSDPAIREAARRELLALRLEDLPTLLEAVRLLPEGFRSSSLLALTLRDAVVHIHLRDAKARLLASRRAEIGIGRAYLGVTLGGDLWKGEYSGRSGAPIRATAPGFVAYEVFEEGDLLIGVRTEDGLERLTTVNDLHAVFQRLAPGDHVEFLVVRGGRILRIPVTVDERLADLPGLDEEWDESEATALREADAFWQERFVPILSQRGGPTANVE